MRKNFFKCILNLFLVFTTIITLFSCNSNEIKLENLDINSDNSTTPTNSTSFNGDNIMDYKIQEMDGEYYIVFDDISKYIKDTSSNTSSMPITWITFDSVSKMQNDILNGQLSHSEKNIMANHFERDENQVLIPNPYNVYSFTHPSEYQIRDGLTLHYNGYVDSMTMYKFNQNSNTAISYWMTNILTKKHYNYLLKKNFSQFVENDSINFTKEKELSNGNTIQLSESLIVSNYSYKTEKYVMTDSNKTIFVKKQSCSDDGYVQVFLVIVINDNIYCSIQSDGMEISFDEYLTDEFLFGFDVKAVEKT